MHLPLFASIPETLDFERENYASVPYLDGKGYVTYAYNISGGAVVRWCRDSLAFYLKKRQSSAAARSTIS